MRKRRRLLNPINNGNAVKPENKKDWGLRPFLFCFSVYGRRKRGLTMHRLSFLRRIQLSFFIFILLPFVVMMIWTYHSLGENVSGKLIRSNEENLQVIANQLSRTIDNVSYASVYFSDGYDSALLESLRELQDADSFSSYAAFTHYDRLRMRATVLSVQSLDANLQLFLVNRTNKIIMGNMDRPAFSPLSAGLIEASRQLDEGETAELQWFSYGEQDKEPGYYYAARIIQDPRNRTKLGTLYVGIPAGYFQHLLDTGNPASRLVLEDRHGKTIASRGQGLGAGQMLRAGEVVIPRTNWKLSGEINRKTVTGEINQEFVLTLSVVGMFFVFFLVLSVLWAGRINKPIALLRVSVKQYIGGNRKVRIPVQGKDEVAVLSTAFNQVFDDVEQLLQQVEREQEEKRKLEIHALAAQIRPHFLLNTLNSIKASLILSGDREHSGMLDSLMTLLRAYIRTEEPVDLTQEIRLLDSYVRLMQIRYRLNIAFSPVIAPELANLRLPRLLLQPLVENAVLHGFIDRPPEPEIMLSAVPVPGGVEITVLDNGLGMDEEMAEELNRRLAVQEKWQETSGSGVGLVNTARRLAIAYGPRARLTATLPPEGGVAMVLFLPQSDVLEVLHVHRDAD